MKQSAKRASGSEKRKATTSLCVRLTPAERELLEEMAASQSVSLGALMRSAVFQRPLPRRRKKPTVSERLISQLLGQLGKMGSNLNQIARSSTMNSLSDFRALREMQKDLAKMRDACLRILGYDL